MAKVSQELSADTNNHRVGVQGGRSSRDINPPGENQTTASYGESDVSKSLSKDSAKLTQKSAPDNGIFKKKG